MTKHNLLYFAIIALINFVAACTLSANSGTGSKNIAEANAAGSSNKQPAVVYKGHNLPHMRGAMISPNVTEEDLRVLGMEWHANLVRWQLNKGDRAPDNLDLKAYDDWLEKALVHLDKLLPVCKEAGLKVVIDFHTTPGGRNGANENLIFKEKKYQDKFLDVWEKIARRYKGNDVVWGYDLANEPEDRKMTFGLMNWHELATQAAQKVRAIDASHAIIYEPIWADPDRLRKVEPLVVPGVVYSVHMYKPLELTHQGVLKDKPVGVGYPEKIKVVMWDKDQLRRALQPVVDFQRKYGVHIYIGEFSAVRWAPDNSAYNYLKDLIDIFEENGWDWTYHAFREWSGWSVEHGQNQNDNSPAKEQTQREQLLKSWFKKNVNK